MAYLAFESQNISVKWNVRLGLNDYPQTETAIIQIQDKTNQNIILFVH